MREKKILIFAGTTEGKRLTEILVQNHVRCTVSVATQYGVQTMGECPGAELLQGRLNETEMETLMREGAYEAVVDATHPFAVEVSQNVRDSAERTKTAYLRLKRDTSGEEAEESDGGEHFFADASECAEFLEGTKGNILLTTGSKDLGKYTADPKLRDRLFVRVLPAKESIEICEQERIAGSRIIAMQGPFSAEMNLALLRQFDIRFLVTKESGVSGGYEQKISAAREAGCEVCVIRNPERGEGLTLSQVLAELAVRLGRKFRLQTGFEITLVGAGVGDGMQLTAQAGEVIRQADHIFGAKRLESLAGGKNFYPCYLAGDIIPCLEKIMEKERDRGRKIRVAILFSGDSGFYSGCSAVYQKLLEWSGNLGESCETNVHILPGISSVSYLAAATGYSWENAGIISLHGRGSAETWQSELEDAVQSNRKTFVLTSGAEDVRKMGEILEEWEKRQESRNSVRIYTGYRLSYPEEEILLRTPAECRLLERDGLYTCLVLKDAEETERFVTHGLGDECFARGDVPMTKEEVRSAAISKLQLTENAVVYDIGSGTGSVAVEIARLARGIRVYAIEQRDEAVALIRQNAQRFGLSNLKLIQATAPDKLGELPPPTHVFIGGSGGKLQEILEILRQKGKPVRVVMTAVSLETMSQIVGLEDAEIVCVQVSRAKKVGGYHLMQAQNPVYIASFNIK